MVPLMSLCPDPNLGRHRVRREQERIAKAGYKFRVLISYGDAWWAWYMRRLAERPANVLFVIKTMFAR